MTTVRDVIADKLQRLFDISDERAAAYADGIIKAQLSAPEPVRLELAGLLNPWRPADSAPKNGDEFLAELCGNTYAVVFYDEHPDYGDAVWPTADGIRYQRGALTRWMLLPRPDIGGQVK